MTTRHVIGAMSGTSCDGIDASLVRLTGTGLDLQVTPLAEVSQDLGELGLRLRAFADGKAYTAGEIAAMRADLADGYAQAVTALSGAGHPAPDLVVVHGQTVFHQPPLTWQLIDLPRLAMACDTRVVGDLRSADCARGGQGAPITPLADLILFGDQHDTRVVVNLGGFINLTVLPPGRDPASVSGQDLCPCNQWLDRLARKRLQQPFDAAGAVMASGTPDPTWVERWRAQLAACANGGRSLGSGDERIVDDAPELSTPDTLASAGAALAQCLTDHIQHAAPARLILAGGGCHNRGLITAMSAAADRYGLQVQTSDSFGIPVQQREAIAMAVLGDCAERGISITLPQVTGCGFTGPDGASANGPQRI